MMKQPIKQEGEYTCFMYTLLRSIVPPAEL